MTQYQLERPRIKRAPLTPAMRGLMIGDSLKVKFKDHSENYARKTASELNKLEGKKYTVDATHGEVYMIITRIA